MYYNKGKVNEQLEDGIDDSADIIEELYDFINELQEAVNDGNESEINRLLKDWEG